MFESESASGLEIVFFMLVPERFRKSNGHPFATETMPASAQCPSRIYKYASKRSMS
jgi:hypothetical protein